MAAYMDSSINPKNYPNSKCKFKKYIEYAGFEVNKQIEILIINLTPPPPIPILVC